MMIGHRLPSRRSGDSCPARHTTSLSRSCGEIETVDYGVPDRQVCGDSSQCASSFVGSDLLSIGVIGTDEFSKDQV